MIQINKIKGKMRELEITQADAAAELNLHETTFNGKLNHRNGAIFTVQEAAILADLLHLTDAEKVEYFFLSTTCV